MREVVITGIGIVNATGNNQQECWKNTVEGISGIGTITHFDIDERFPSRIAGEVKITNFEDIFDKKEASRIQRFEYLAARAASEAIKDADLDLEKGDANRYGCAIGVGIGGLEAIEKNTLVLAEKGPRKISPFFLPYTILNMAVGVVSKKFNLRGPNICPATACASGTHAIGESFHLIASGFADVMIAGGAESSISPLGVSAFSAMRALSTYNDCPEKASRPFDKTRDGFVIGEGSGILILEEKQRAVKRGVRTYAEVIGWGMSGDAYHISSPSPEGRGAVRCMQSCLDYAKISPEQVDYINAHGTSTKLNDFYETLAIKKIFGSHAKSLAISSTKGVTGHCLGAAGGIEAAYTALALYHRLMPPTANYEYPDPDCDLDYLISGAREAPIHYALSNSFGFGGTNCTVAIKSIY